MGESIENGLQVCSLDDLAILFTLCLISSTASRKLEPWFPVHPDRDIYVSLLQCDPPAHDGLIKAALIRRAVADVHRIFRVREDKTALTNLLQRGSIGDDLWTSFQAAEKELEAEILEVVTEAETFKQGWGGLIFQTAVEIVQNEKLREGMNRVFHSRPELGKSPIYDIFEDIYTSSEAKYGVTKRIIPSISVNPNPQPPLPPASNVAMVTTPVKASQTVLPTAASLSAPDTADASSPSQRSPVS